MSDKFRKCNNFMGYRRPSEREKDYIERTAMKKGAIQAMAVVLGLLGVFMLGLVRVIFAGELAVMTPAEKGGIIGMVLVMLVIAVYVFIRRRKYVNIREGRYDILEGTATYYSFNIREHHVSRRGRNVSKNNYYQAVKDFVSVNGETDNVHMLLEVPQNAYIRNWSDGKEFPVLLIRIDGKVGYAVTDWEKIQQHDRYREVAPVKRDMCY